MKPLFASALFGTAVLSGMAQASLPQNPLPVAVYSLPGSDFSALGRGEVASDVRATENQNAKVTKVHGGN